MNPTAKAFHALLQEQVKAVAVFFAKEDLGTCISPPHHMINRPQEVDARSAGHRLSIQFHHLQSLALSPI